MTDYEFDQAEAEANGAPSVTGVREDAIAALADAVDPLHGVITDPELRTACEVFGRELVREVFDSLEEHIVQYHASVKLQLATALARLYRARSTREIHEAAVEVASRRGIALGISMLAEHLGTVSETEWHGAARRRLATLTVEDLGARSKSDV